MSTFRVLASHSCDEPATVKFLQRPPAHYEYFASSSEYAVRIRSLKVKESDNTVNLSTTIGAEVAIVEFRVRDVTFPKLCNVLFNVKCTVYKLGQNRFKANEVRNETITSTSVYHRISQ